jgi:hypothetical protein
MPSPHFIHKNSLPRPFLIKLSRPFRVAWTAVPRGQIKLMILAKPIPVPDRGKPRTHSREPAIGLFNEGRIVLEMGALLADRPGGMTQLNVIKNFHTSMRYNARPIMTKNNHRQNVSQNDVDNNPGSERDKGFAAGIG